MLKVRNKNLELCHAMKYARIFSGPEKFSSTKLLQSIKRPKKNKIYHSIDYTNFYPFGHQIESASEK